MFAKRVQPKLYLNTSLHTNITQKNSELERKIAKICFLGEERKKIKNDISVRAETWTPALSMQYKKKKEICKVFY